MATDKPANSSADPIRVNASDPSTTFQFSRIFGCLYQLRFWTDLGETAVSSVYEAATECIEDDWKTRWPGGFLMQDLIIRDALASSVS